MLFLFLLYSQHFLLHINISPCRQVKRSFSFFVSPCNFEKRGIETHNNSNSSQSELSSSKGNRNRKKISNSLNFLLYAALFLSINVCLHMKICDWTLFILWPLSFVSPFRLSYTIFFSITSIEVCRIFLNIWEWNSVDSRLLLACFAWPLPFFRFFMRISMGYCLKGTLEFKWNIKILMIIGM